MLCENLAEATAQPLHDFATGEALAAADRARFPGPLRTLLTLFMVAVNFVTFTVGSPVELFVCPGSVSPDQRLHLRADACKFDGDGSFLHMPVCNLYHGHAANDVSLPLVNRIAFHNMRQPWLPLNDDLPWCTFHAATCDAFCDTWFNVPAFIHCSRTYYGDGGASKSNEHSPDNATWAIAALKHDGACTVFDGWLADTVIVDETDVHFIGASRQTSGAGELSCLCWIALHVLTSLFCDASSCP